MLLNISVRYDPLEDRLLLRLTLRVDGQPVEHWLHLTRRICIALRRDLQAMVDLSAELPERLDKGARAVVSAAHHQAVSSQVPTRTEAADEAPAPEQPPALVTKVVCGRRRADARWVVQFERRGQPPLALVLSNPTLHALVDALSRRVAVAHWALPELPLERTAPQPGVGGALH